MGFLGLSGYYRGFIKDYGKTAQPLTELTKQENFHWSDQQHSAFDTLKLRMTGDPILQLPNVSKPFSIDVMRQEEVLALL